MGDEPITSEDISTPDPGLGPAPQPYQQPGQSMPAWGFLLIVLSLAIGIVAGLFIGLAVGGDDAAAVAAPAEATTITSATSERPTTSQAPATTAAPGGGPTLDAAAYGTVAVTGQALPLLGTTPQDTAVGLSIPEIVGNDFAGAAVAITDDGMAKLIMIVAHWCPYCQDEIPVVRDWYAANELPENVSLYAATIWSDPTRENFPPGAWLEREQFDVPVIVDDEAGSIATALGVSGVPFWVLVNTDGTVAARGSGAIPEEAITEIVDMLAAGPDTDGS